LKKLETTIGGLIRQHDEQSEAQLKSLVKVYENMKPKDAARIFEELEMTVLLDVVERMKESKIAPILASMDPAKAKAVTVELATRRKLPESGG
jgi:flagellar motility protein MotE (MotC chaperone)